MRKLLFVITAGVIVLLLIMVFFVIQLLSSRSNPSRNNGVIIPTPIPESVRLTLAPTLPVNYNFDKAGQLADRAKNRQSLSVAGAQAKQKLIDSLSTSSGPVYTSENVRIGYIASPDLFQAELLSDNINAAKTEAVNWMLTQGFTQDDLCRLPFSFYLGPIPAETLMKTRAAFNPLPNGC